MIWKICAIAYLVVGYILACGVFTKELRASPYMRTWDYIGLLVGCFMIGQLWLPLLVWRRLRGESYRG